MVAGVTGELNSHRLYTLPGTCRHPLEHCHPFEYCIDSVRKASTRSCDVFTGLSATTALPSTDERESIVSFRLDSNKFGSFHPGRHNGGNHGGNHGGHHGGQHGGNHGG